MKPTRLAYLVSQYPAVSHTFVLREVRGLREAGFDIHVASINAPDRPRRNLTFEEREEAERTYYVKTAGPWAAARMVLSSLVESPVAWFGALAYALQLAGTDLKRLLYAFFYFTEAVMIGRWMRVNGTSHLHVHFATPASTVGLIVTRLFPVTLSITVHGPDEFYDAPGYRLAEKIAGSSFLCCIGTYARSQLMKLSPFVEWAKFELSPLGVDPDQFAPRPTPATDDAFEVLCVGRLVPAKGQHILVSAIAKLVREGRPVRLRLVGDGPDRASLEADVAARGLQDHVTFEGAVNQDRIRELYARAHVFALASFAEGIPVVLMEAMSMEIPCVTTCITGIPELIRDEVEGLLVSPSDEDALAGALARLMDEPEFAEQLGRHGRRRVQEKYHLERNTQRLGEIFSRRLSGPALET